MFIEAFSILSFKINKFTYYFKKSIRKIESLIVNNGNLIVIYLNYVLYMYIYI